MLSRTIIKALKENLCSLHLKEETDSLEQVQPLESEEGLLGKGEPAPGSGYLLSESLRMPESHVQGRPSS